MLASQPPVPPPSSPAGFGPSHWDPLVIALAGMMCTVFLILSFRKIIQRHCNDFIPTRLTRNSGRRQMLIDGIILDDPSLQFHSRGLDSFVMHSLPITQFQKTKKKKEKEEEVVAEENMECSICLGEFEDGEWLKHLSNCSHVFHVSCIDTWFQTHSSCPVCRSYVYPETSHETSVSMEEIPERREEVNRNNPRNFQALRTHLLQSSPIRLQLLQIQDVHHLR